jgi:hypothetical protein
MLSLSLPARGQIIFGTAAKLMRSDAVCGPVSNGPSARDERARFGARSLIS